MGEGSTWYHTSYQTGINGHKLKFIYKITAIANLARHLQMSDKNWSMTYDCTVATMHIFSHTVGHKPQGQLKLQSQDTQARYLHQSIMRVSMC